MENLVTQTRTMPRGAGESELGRILEESLNEIYIFDAESLRFLNVNRGARQNLGYSMDELSELTPLDLKPEFSAKSFEQLILPLQTRAQRQLRFETVHRRKNGTLYPIELHLQLATFDGQPAFVAIVLDTTERKRIETALQESEALHRITLKNISDAVFVTDDAGNLRFVCPNVDVIFGFSEGEVVAMGNLAQLFDGDLIDDQELEECCEVSNVQRSIVDKFGGRHDLLINVKRVAIRGGTRLYTCRDVTRLKAAQDRAVQAERLAAIGQMLSAIAHESRNSLQQIQSGVDMLKLEIDEESDASLDLGNIARASDDLQRLFAELGSFAAPIHLEKSNQSLATIWRQVWSNLESARGGREAELHEEVSGAEPICCVDTFRIGQVFRNIFENSLAACNDPVLIGISIDDCELDGKPAVMVSVCDNGPGLSDDQKRRIFEPFFTTKAQGSGLGMAITKRIVDTHGGVIRVGKCNDGAEFEILLTRSSP
jgi:PAS domain S-box-containing protein